MRHSASSPRSFLPDPIIEVRSRGVDVGAIGADLHGAQQGIAGQRVAQRAAWSGLANLSDRHHPWDE